MANANAAAKAALKGKNNLRKKKVRTNVHFKRPKTLRLARYIIPAILETSYIYQLETQNVHQSRAQQLQDSINSLLSSTH